MFKEKRVATLKPGNVFRDWLVEVLGDRIRKKKSRVKVYKLAPSSHTVCRYEFEGDDYGVIAKFYAEPTGWNRNCNPARAMHREFETLKKVEPIIDIPKPIAAKKEFHCALITEYVQGKDLYKYMNDMNGNGGLYGRLTAIAHVQRNLHDRTRSYYHKDEEFARFHRLLDQLRLDPSTRMKYNRLLGEWWYSNLIDQPYGCRIHNDATPVNYLFNHKKVYALDFESSWEHANFVHDLGTVAAELKHYFAMHKGDGRKAEPYIGHFLWQYSRDEAEFRRITQALPFFMSLGLLRMARRKLGPRHRAYVLREATECLKYPHFLQ